MKKILCLSLAVIICIGMLCACSGGENADPTPTPVPQTFEPTGEYIKGKVTVYDTKDEILTETEVSVSQFIATNAVIKALDLAGIEYRSSAGTLEMVNGIEASDTHAWYYIIDGLQASNGNFPIEDGFELAVHYFTNE